MTLDQLRYFYEAAKLQHVGKAAKAVHISASSISAAIATLESELGCTLFHRQGKSIALTENGRRLKAEAEILFDRVAGIAETVRGESGHLSGSYRLGASHFLASHYLSGAWSDIQAKHPDLVGEICSLSTVQVIRELVTGSLDLGLCFSPLNHPGLAQRVIHQGKLVVAVRHSHPVLKAGGRKALRLLSELPAVIHKGHLGVDLCEAHPIFERYGVTPKIRFLFDSDACAVAKVTSSNAWTLLPDLVVGANPKVLQAIGHPSDWDATYSVALVFRNERSKSPILDPILQELGNRIRSAQPSRTHVR